MSLIDASDTRTSTCVREIFAQGFRVEISLAFLHSYETTLVDLHGSFFFLNIVDEPVTDFHFFWLRHHGTSRKSSLRVSLSRGILPQALNSADNAEPGSRWKRVTPCEQEYAQTFHRPDRPIPWDRRSKVSICPTAAPVWYIECTHTVSIKRQVRQRLHSSWTVI